MNRLFLAPLLLCACGGDAAESSSFDDSPDAAVVANDGFTGCPSTAPQLTLGMRASGQSGSISASLVAASNLPARRYLNDWTLAFSSAAGTLLTDVTVVQARTFMPVHGHDGIVPARVEAPSLPGQLRIDDLNFNMRGPWQVQLMLSSASAGSDFLVFSICVAE